MNMETDAPSPISNLMDSSLKLSSRVLTPFEESDSVSLSFAAAALLMSCIFSWLGISGRGPLSSLMPKELPSPKENEIEESIMKIRNNLIYNRNGLVAEPFKPKLPKVTVETYENALKAFEKFMKWSTVESKNSQILEDVLELAISKARGEVDPSDVFLDYALVVIEDMLKKTQNFFVSYIFK
ncbi:UNVERIFIED_CONTAM: hypothetical protein RMT77_010606 [Armadillidium vulgare]